MPKRVPQPPPDLLSTRQVAELLGVDVTTVNRWAVSGKLVPFSEIPGRTGARMFLRSEAETLKAATS